MTWQLWIDTGGTFTDCLALDRSGLLRRAKVLSASALRGEVVAREERTVRFESDRAAPCDDLYRGGRLRALGDERGIAVEASQGDRLRLASPWAGVVPSTAEVAFDEEAPVLAARVITGTPGGHPLPELELRGRVDPGDPGRISLGISCGGVWVSRDAGGEWQCIGEGWRSDYMPPELLGDPAIQDVHRLGQCGAHPDALWVQHHNGIFRSTDGGQHWKELEDVSPSAFGFALAAHPTDPDTAWFVPEIKDERRIPVDGKLVVNRTRDGGRSFETLSRGLPQEHAYDLVYRHGLAIDAGGKALAMGSTTGSLFVSEDSGDSWSCISTHLPPVYALRFKEQGS